MGNLKKLGEPYTIGDNMLFFNTGKCKRALIKFQFSIDDALEQFFGAIAYGQNGWQNGAKHGRYSLIENLAIDSQSFRHDFLEGSVGVFSQGNSGNVLWVCLKIGTPSCFTTMVPL